MSAPIVTARTLQISGMTCASCVGRVEKALRRLDGVTTASVNLATETATVDYDPTAAGLDQITAAEDAAGYTATVADTGEADQAVPSPAPGNNDDRESRRDAELARLKHRWQVSLSAGLG